MDVNIAQVGLGYWGPNLVRNLTTIEGGQLHTLCDSDSQRLMQSARQYPHVNTQTNYEAVLEDPHVNAVVLATPVKTHFDMTKAALQAGKHVMVEKPLAQTPAQCQELIELAEINRLVLMVGHVFLYNSAVRKVKEYIETGELGEIYYVHSQRLNFGLIRQDVNALWNFAPHDLSILFYWLNSVPNRLTARGYAYIQPNIEDVIFMTLDFHGGIGASIHISWLDPRKVRLMTVVGSEKMVVFDDVSPEAKLIVYDRGMSRSPVIDGWMSQYETLGQFQTLVRTGDVTIPKLDFKEPLKEECRHFVECIRSGESPISDGHNGLQVVQTLAAAQHSLEMNGEPVTLPSDPRRLRAKAPAVSTEHR